MSNNTEIDDQDTEQVEAQEVTEHEPDQDVAPVDETSPAGDQDNPAGDDTADVVNRRLFEALVKLDGRLQDVTDVPYDEGLLQDEEKLSDTITDLLERKPHLRKREFAADIGGGKRGSAAPEAPDLINIIRGMI